MAKADRFDVAIVGAGVVGLAIAQRLSAAWPRSRRSIVLLEQESRIGQHISSRNSEVIHAGLYYPTGSLKASLCVRGRQLLYEHCQRYQVPHRRQGKLIVAGAGETGQLETLMRQGQDNGVEDLKLLDRRQLRSQESAVSGEAALLSPSTGIVDAHQFMISLLQLAESQGVLFAPRTRTLAIETKNNGFEVLTTSTGKNVADRYAFDCSVLINCAGLQAPQVAQNILGLEQSMVPDLYYCKGDYFSYRGKNPFRHLIYPVPLTNTVGLGIHATTDLAGRLRFGPDTRYLDDIDYRIDPRKAESFGTAIRRYFPAIKTEDLSPDYSGIRPKLSGPGQPAADFVIQQVDQHGIPGLIQLFGIESPGLTASLAIANLIRDAVRREL